MLIAAAIIGLGSSIFHPESSRVARAASGGRFGFAQSFFQVGGNTGQAIGPLLAALIIAPNGQDAVAWFVIVPLVGSVPTLETLLLVRSDLAAERRVQNLRFVGLTLAYAAAPRFFHNYAGTQAGFHPVRQLADESDRPGRMPAAVVFDATSHCRLESCCVVHVGGTAVSLQGSADSNVVAGNVIASENRLAANPLFQRVTGFRGAARTLSGGALRGWEPTGGSGGRWVTSGPLRRCG